METLNEVPRTSTLKTDVFTMKGVSLLGVTSKKASPSRITSRMLPLYSELYDSFDPLFKWTLVPSGKVNSAFWPLLEV